MSKDDMSNRILFGKEGNAAHSRLNALKPVYLGARTPQEERSWVLFDDRNEAHRDIPAHITNEEQLPPGALVISVDLTPVSQEQQDHLRKHGEDHPRTHGYAVYFTSRSEQQLKALQGLVGGRMDNGGDPASYIVGNNHPESPVPGLRRLTAAERSVDDTLALLALGGRQAGEAGGLESAPSAAREEVKRLFNAPVGLLSLDTATQLAQAIAAIPHLSAYANSAKLRFNPESKVDDVRATRMRKDAEVIAESHVKRDSVVDKEELLKRLGIEQDQGGRKP